MTTNSKSSLKSATLRGQKRRQANTSQGSFRKALRLSKAQEATKKVVLEVSFSANYGNFDKLSEIVEQAAGCSSDSSGFGFGVRDLSFSFKTVQEAQKAADRIQALNLTNYTADLSDDWA